jgi:nicotinate-nucleotide--dimethylbenzimidazole phosphoribosyltransferase
MNNFKTLAIISEMLKDMPVKDSEAEAKAIAHQNQLTKPPRALGVLEDLAVFLGKLAG